MTARVTLPVTFPEQHCARCFETIAGPLVRVRQRHGVAVLCAPCAAPVLELAEHAPAPEPCAACDRPVVDLVNRPRLAVTCSPRCAAVVRSRRRRARRGAEAFVPDLDPERVAALRAWLEQDPLIAEVFAAAGASEPTRVLQ